MSHTNVNDEGSRSKRKKRANIKNIKADDDGDTVCAMCNKGSDAKKLVLCDGCGEDGACHTFCMDPPLSTVPKGRWFCASCEDERVVPVSPKKRKDEESGEEEEKYQKRQLVPRKKRLVKEQEQDEEEETEVLPRSRRSIQNKEKNASSRSKNAHSREREQEDDENELPRRRLSVQRSKEQSNSKGKNTPSKEKNTPSKEKNTPSKEKNTPSKGRNAHAKDEDSDKDEEDGEQLYSETGRPKRKARDSNSPQKIAKIQLQSSPRKGRKQKQQEAEAEDEESEDDDTACEICRKDSDPAKLLLCDGEECGLGYHMYCLDPPLTRVPRGKWRCPECQIEEPKASPEKNGAKKRKEPPKPSKGKKSPPKNESKNERKLSPPRKISLLKKNKEKELSESEEEEDSNDDQLPLRPIKRPTYFEDPPKLITRRTTPLKKADKSESSEQLSDLSNESHKDSLEKEEKEGGGEKKSNAGRPKRTQSKEKIKEDEDFSNQESDDPSDVNGKRK